MKIIIQIDTQKEIEKVRAEFSPEWQSRLIPIYELLEKEDYEAARKLWLELPDPDGIDDWESGRSYICKDLRVLFENFHWAMAEKDNSWGSFFDKLERKRNLEELRGIWEQPDNSFFSLEDLERCKISQEEVQYFRENGKKVDFPDIDGGFSVYTLEDGRTFVEENK